MNLDGYPVDQGIAMLRRVLEKHDAGDHRIEGIAVSAEIDHDEKGQLNITTLTIYARPRKDGA